MPWARALIAHDGVQNVGRARDVFLRQFSFRAAVAHPSKFFRFDGLDEGLIFAKTSPNIVGEPVFLFHRGFGKQAPAVTAAVDNQLEIVGEWSGVVHVASASPA